MAQGNQQARRAIDATAMHAPVMNARAPRNGDEYDICVELVPCMNTASVSSLCPADLGENGTYALGAREGVPSRI